VASGQRGRRDEILALGQEAPVALALALVVQASDGLQAGVLGGCDLAHLSCLRLLLGAARLT
jgi:hypothetical protein